MAKRRMMKADWTICLSSDGSIVAIGAHKNDGNGANSGHMSVSIRTAHRCKWTRI